MKYDVRNWALNEKSWNIYVKKRKRAINQLQLNKSWSWKEEHDNVHCLWTFRNWSVLKICLLENTEPQVLSSLHKINSMGEWGIILCKFYSHFLLLQYSASAWVWTILKNICLWHWFRIIDMEDPIIFKTNGKSNSGNFSKWLMIWKIFCDCGLTPSYHIMIFQTVFAFLHICRPLAIPHFISYQ